jgi:hypothetical protein
MQIVSLFNDPWVRKTAKTGRRGTRPAIIHVEESEHQFRRGTKHTCYTTTADGTHYKDITLVQRCPCGARNVTRVSRTKID